MNNQEPQSRVKRYDFNKGSKQPNQNPKKFRVWPWILGLVVIIVLLVGGIKVLTANQNNQQSPQSQSSVVQSSNKKQSSSQNSQSTTSSSHNERKQKATKSSEHIHTNPQQEQKPKAPANGSSFGTPRQFSSVADATSWARATQASWINAGYNNYTITSDGQGYYVLTFIK